MGLSLIVAHDLNYGIGKNNGLPWRMSGDMAYFKNITTTTLDPAKINAVVMGRHTWDSIPSAFRPLPLRTNVVVSSQSILLPDSVLLFSSLDDSIHTLLNNSRIETVFVIGGASVYRQILEYPQLETLYITEIGQSFDCDAFFPTIPSQFSLQMRSDTHVENGIPFSFCTYTKT